MIFSHVYLDPIHFRFNGKRTEFAETPHKNGKSFSYVHACANRRGRFPAEKKKAMAEARAGPSGPPPKKAKKSIPLSKVTAEARASQFAEDKI